MTRRMKPGVRRNASTQITVWRSRTSDETVSLAKKRAKKARVSTKNGSFTSRRHGGDETRRPLVDAFLGDQRREDRVERGQTQGRPQVAHRIVADHDAVLENDDARADLLDDLEHVRGEHDHLALVGERAYE